MALDLSGVQDHTISQTVRATCLKPDCHFNLVAFKTGAAGTDINKLQAAVRQHVLLSNHQIYIVDERSLVVLPDNKSN